MVNKVTSIKQQPAKMPALVPALKNPFLDSSRKRKSGAAERCDTEIKGNLLDFQFRIGRAGALARSMALALEGHVLAFEIEATEGCLGIAELLDGIRDEMYDLSQSKFKVD